MDADEDDLLCTIEDLARKAFVLFELADERLLAQTQLAQTARTSGTPTGLTGTTPPFSMQAAAAAQAGSRRKSSSSSMNSEVWILRQQEAAANDAVVLYMKSLAFIVKAMDKVKRYWKNRTEGYDRYVASQELNESKFCFFLIQFSNYSADNIQWANGFVLDSMRSLRRQSGLKRKRVILFSSQTGLFTTKLEIPLARLPLQSCKAISQLQSKDMRRRCGCFKPYWMRACMRMGLSQTKTRLLMKSVSTGIVSLA